MTPATEMSGNMPSARQAALLLHGMPEADRRWILSELPTAQRHSLQGLLQELRELGIARDPSLVMDAIAPALPKSLTPSKTVDLNTLTPQSSALLLGLLKDESAGVWACLLDHQSWAWESELLEHLPLTLRQRITSLRGENPAQARSLAVVHAVQAHLQRAIDAHEDVVPSKATSMRPASGVLQRWFGPWMGRRTRIQRHHHG